MNPSDIDLKMMRRCVELSADAVRAHELPFSCVVCRDGEIVVEATNRVSRDGDVTRHAEIIAISEAQRILGRKDLSDCTLYSNVEPCPMCSFPIRETRIGRVVYSISSPMIVSMRAEVDVNRLSVESQRYSVMQFLSLSSIDFSLWLSTQAFGHD